MNWFTNGVDVLLGGFDTLLGRTASKARVRVTPCTLSDAREAMREARASMDPRTRHPTRQARKR